VTYVSGIPGEPRGFSGYGPGGDQIATRAPFLLLGCRFIQPDVSKPGFSLRYELYPGELGPDGERDTGETPKLWAILRRVALRQCGHYMMGSARIGGRRMVVSGAYGSDGLPETLNDWSPADFARWTLCPEEIARAYWHPESSGWNSTGSERETLVRWARSGALRLPERSGRIRAW
jgi:hypothetical protein